MTLQVLVPVTAHEWRDRSGQRNGQPTSGVSRPVKTSGTPTNAEHWEAIIDEIVALERLGDNWDGLGAAAPSHELVASAVGLAYLLKDAGADAPDAAIQGTDGSVNFVWHGPDGGYCEVEIDRPLHAEVMVLEPGQAPRYWVWPDA